MKINDRKVYYKMYAMIDYDILDTFPNFRK